MATFVLVQTDPTYEYTLRVFNDLSRHSCLVNLATNSVTNDFICNSTHGTNWTSMYNFSRSAAVVLRAFFIDAFNLDRYAGVEYPRNETTGPNRRNNLRRIATYAGFPHVTNDRDVGQMMYERFDQMFPHYVVERELQNAGMMSRGCVVIAPRAQGGWKLFQAITTLYLRRQGQVYTSSGHVIVIGGELLFNPNVDSWRTLAGIIAPAPEVQVDEELEDEESRDDDEEEDVF